MDELTQAAPAEWTFIGSWTGLTNGVVVNPLLLTDCEFVAPAPPNPDNLESAFTIFRELADSPPLARAEFSACVPRFARGTTATRLDNIGDEAYEFKDDLSVLVFARRGSEIMDIQSVTPDPRIRDEVSILAKRMLERYWNG